MTPQEIDEIEKNYSDHNFTLVPRLCRELRESIKSLEGEKAKKRGDRMAVKRGGKVHERAAGGRVKGADLSPFSSAHDGGPKVGAGSENEHYEEEHKRGGKVSKRAHGGKVEHHGAHPVHKEEHGEAVKKALHKGGRC